MIIWTALVAILKILGALGIFLYGMKVMSEGIQKAAGGGMRRALATMTHNRVSSVFTGFFTTSLVQSSSATTVLVVSFANAGLLTLTASIGVIMGANLGTTITAWLVAWIGKFSISSIALPIIGIGLPLFFVGKEKLKASGETLIGFGLLFTGLSFLKKSVPDLKSGVKENEGLQETIQGIIEFLTSFGSAPAIVLFLIAGILLTLIVQSSSAAMAITITCAWNGWLGEDPFTVFQYSAAIVLGENIGTTVTAWLASIGTGVNAKRAARAHFLFNVIGTIWALLAFALMTKWIWAMVGLFPESIVNIKTAKGVASNPLTIVAFAVALFHTCFNLLNIFLLIWFVPQIANIVQKWVKDPDEEEKTHLRYISQTLVDLGELNIAEADGAIHKMSQLCVEMFDGFIEVFEHPKDDMSTQVSALKKIEDESDLMLQEITEYLVRCSSKDIGEQNASRIAHMLRVTQELEECIDCIYRLVKLNERRYKKDRQFAPEQQESIREYAGNIAHFIEFTDAHLLSPVSEEDNKTAEAMRSTALTMRKKLNKSTMKRMATGKVKLEMINIDINNHFDAIANHALHILQTSQAMHE